MGQVGRDVGAAGPEGLIGAVHDLSAARSPDQIHRIVAKAARQLTGSDGATVARRSGADVLYVAEDAIGPLWQGRRLPLAGSVSGWCVLKEKPVAIGDVYADPRAPQDLYRPTFVRGLVVVPVRPPDPIGAIGCYWAEPHAAADAEVRVLAALADATAVALENAAIRADLEARVRDRTAQLEEANARLQREILDRRRAEEEVRQLSLTDELTGLYNRRGFALLAAQELRALQRAGRRALVLYVDLDGLKQANDSLGHGAGDRLLARAASVLRSVARGADVVARIGGDEFAVFMPLGTDDVSVPAIVERFLDAARAAGVKWSVGATATQPGRVMTLDDLLVGADEAMYRGRRARRGRRDEPAPPPG